MSYIIIKDGNVIGSPDLIVIDLDLLTGPDRGPVWEAEVQSLIKKAQYLGLDDIVREAQTKLDEEYYVIENWEDAAFLGEGIQALSGNDQLSDQAE